MRMSPQSSYTVTMPANMTPPHDLASYSRFMHQHTKRQMEAVRMSPSRQGRSSGRSRDHSPVPAMMNGTPAARGASSRSTARLNGAHEYHD
ncbi:hypothetical protein F5Y17DRAFT_411361 [Xylariaceae sp. FL0594]|nr:hypothetical protein F5Y17DRAFT_411361 [Xylariaceae sp. FL0594]